MKRRPIIYLLAAVFFSFMGCTSNEQPKANSTEKPTEAGETKVKFMSEPPEVKITLDKETIDYVVGKNEWNGAKYDRKDTFQAIMEKDSKIVVPYIKLGKDIKIEFKENPPKTIEIYDYILEENGTAKYDYRTIKQIPVELKDGTCSFKFDRNPAVGFSSNSEDYEPGKTLRGFKVVCSWDGDKGENECEYGFIIRTDSGFGGFQASNSSKSLEFSFDESGNYIGFSDLPSNYTIEKAKEDGYYVTQDLEIVANEDVWENFIKATLRKENTSIRMVKFHKESIGSPFFLDLFYNDGYYYLFDSSAEKNEKQPYSHLLTLKGRFGSPLRDSGAIVLTDDDTLTFDKVMRAMLSSSMEYKRSIPLFEVVMLK